jgi:hypothetical protein
LSWAKVARVIVRVNDAGGEGAFHAFDVTVE